MDINARFDRIAEAMEWSIRELDKTPGRSKKVTICDYVLIERPAFLGKRLKSAYTIAVRDYWLSETEVNLKAYCDYTVFVGKLEQGKIAIIAGSDLDTYIRYNKTKSMFFIPPQWWLSLAEMGITWEETEEASG